MSSSHAVLGIWNVGDVVGTSKVLTKLKLGDFCTVICLGFRGRCNSLIKLQISCDIVTLESLNSLLLSCSGGVVIYFDRVEVVNILDSNYGKCACNPLRTEQTLQYMTSQCPTDCH